MELYQERWEASSMAEREAMARRLETELPTGFAFHGIQVHELGGCRNHVAQFRYDAAIFALLPGGRFTLGRDPECLVRRVHPHTAPDERGEGQQQGAVSAADIQHFRLVLPVGKLPI